MSSEGIDSHNQIVMISSDYFMTKKKKKKSWIFLSLYNFLNFRTFYPIKKQLQGILTKEVSRVNIAYRLNQMKCFDLDTLVKHRINFRQLLIFYLQFVMISKIKSLIFKYFHD